MIRLRVKELREERGWSQTELSDRSGVRQAAISAAENGKPLTLDTIEKLADAFGINARFLIEHEPSAKVKR